MSTHIQRGMRAIALCLMSATALVGCGGGGGGGSGDATASRTGVLVAQPLSLSAAAVAPGHDVIMTASCSAGGGALRYQWDLGDGTAPISSTSAVFSHAYDKEGAYLPRVTCIDASGGATVSTATAYLRVTVPMHTVGAFTVTPGSGNQVTASATCTGTTGRSVTFTWNFGDGQSSSQTVETPKASTLAPSGALSFTGSHTYGATGQYTVTGRCTDNETVPDLAQNAVAAPLSVDGAGTVLVGSGLAAKIIEPLAVTPYIPTTVAPATISMRCQATNGQGIAYLFDFGDGTPLLSSRSGWVTHQFTRNGEGKATQYLVTAMCAQNMGDPLQVQTLRVNVRAPELTLLSGDSTLRIFNPKAVAVDATGNLFVISSGNKASQYSDIVKVSPDGRVSTLAGSAPGFADGTGARAQFNNPRGIAVDAKGNVYVADADNNALRKISATGVVTTWGKSWLPDSGAGAGVSVHQFGYAVAVAVDSTGNVYVADAFDKAILRISPAGLVSTVADKLNFQPYGLAIDPMGNVLASGFDGVALNTLHKISPSGVVTKLSDFSDLRGIAIDPLGNIFATDGGTRSVYKIDPGGVKSLFAGAGNGSVGLRDGQGTSAMFRAPSGITLDSSGNVFVADNFNFAIRKISPAGEVTTEFRAGLDDGTGALNNFSTASDFAMDAAGNTYVANSTHHAILKIAPDGAVTTLAGGTQGFADGRGSEARFNSPRAVAVDLSGNVYVADHDNSAIRKINPAGDVETWVGGPSVDPSKQLSATSLAVDSMGNVFESEGLFINKITPAREVTRLGIDLTRTDQRNYTSVAIDAKGYLYVADPLSHVIRKISPALEVTTIGSGTAGYADGTGTAIQFQTPSSLTVDEAGTVYVADGDGTDSGFAIRKCEPTPEGSYRVSTVIGRQTLDGTLPGLQPGVIGEVHGIAISGRRLVFSTTNYIGQVDFAP